jgi:hypothetical protein
MKTPKEQVLEWWNSGADFEQGVALYSLFGHNRTLKNTMHGRKARYEDKLRYELCKDVGLNWLTMPRIKKDPSSITAASVIQTDPLKLPEPERKEDLSLPLDVRHVINEYSECYRERSRLHHEMSSLADNNEKETSQKRSILLDQIKKLSIRMDVLHFAREAYNERKELPDASRLWPEKQEQLTDPLPKDVDQLKQLKKNIQVSLVKDRNWLDYQQKTQKEHKTPMPMGPKRLEIEKRIKAKLKRIEEIEYKIVSLQ